MITQRPVYSGSDGFRLAVILSHPTQYYSPWFRWLNARATFRLRVFYLWDFGIKATSDPHFEKTFVWDVDLLSGYDSEFVPNTAREPGTYRFWGLKNPELTSRLNSWKPDALLLFGYAYASHMGALAWARRRNIPVIFRGDSHLIGRARPRPHVALLLKLLYRQFAAVTYVGQANRAYFESFGVPDERLFFAPHAVDSDRFMPTVESERTAASIRSKLGISSGTRVLLYAGKLIQGKQPRELLQAFVKVDVPSTALLFVGSGAEQASLHEIAQTSKRRNVYFLPFANQSEMPSIYQIGDIFALPSRGLYETWGLAVNEAMHMGLPALVSDRVGCQQDLVEDEVTGWVFKATDTQHLEQQLRRALTADLIGLKPRVRERIEQYSYTQSTLGLEQAIAALSVQNAGSHPDTRR